MIIINTFSDYKGLSNRLPGLVQAHLREHFHNLYEALGDGMSVNTFSLADYGPIILLGPEDDDQGLQGIGLSQGLLGSSPEFVEKIPLGDNYLWFAGIMLSNEACLSVFAVEGEVRPEIEAWFRAGLPMPRDQNK